MVKHDVGLSIYCLLKIDHYYFLVEFQKFDVMTCRAFPFKRKFVNTCM